VFAVAAERVTIGTHQRDDPRASFTGLTWRSSWDDPARVGYFVGYAMWNYLTTPFLFTYDGVVTREGEPWREDGQTWRRLHVTFPERIATHSRQQTFYYDGDGLLRRHDYVVDVNGGAVAGHYTDGHRTFDGLVVPTRRQVYPRAADNTVDRGGAAVITPDVHDVVVR
jgi:hypothetical protein